MAPLMAIVDTSNISSHIVRSIEMPLREIINSTVECRISEMLKEDSIERLLHPSVLDIATLRMEMEERIVREILDKLKNFTKVFSTENKDLDEKVTKVTNNVDVMQLELQQTIDEHIGNNRNQITGVKQDIATLRKELEERITREILDCQY
ncbi:unnamed protein product [Mytilus coruscus]|uniref:Uncharacterized protein n=1 Tax=Mytilus coruscus TaxID=42192 RepID=A0A6J8CXX5_MYTCO|nr:unnamed protein product [Mytilus coruscus]